MDKRAYIKKYLEDFSVDFEDVGMYLAEGGQHYVYHYKNNQVIKFPKNTLLMKMYGMYKCKTMLKCNLLVSEIFKDYAIKSVVILSKDERKYVVIQEFLENGKIITNNNFKNINDQFSIIVKMNRLLIDNHKLCLDFVSFYGFFKTVYATLTRKRQHAVMENILIIEDDGLIKLKIIDFNLLEIRFFNSKINPIHWLVDQCFYRASKFLIKDNFKETI